MPCHIPQGQLPARFTCKGSGGVVSLAQIKPMRRELGTSPDRNLIGRRHSKFLSDSASAVQGYIGTVMLVKGIRESRRQ